MKINLLEIPVIYINLDRDVTKKNRVENFLKTNNFKKIYRSPGILHGEHITGVTLAFKKAFDLATKLNEDMFLILEDDIVPRECFETQIEVPDDFDAFYLGISSWGLRNEDPNYLEPIAGHPNLFTEYTFLEEMPNIVKIYNMLSLHAVIYRSKDYIKKIQEKNITDAIEKKSPIDVEIAISMKNHNIYAFSSPFFYQDGYNKGVTDIDLKE